MVIDWKLALVCYPGEVMTDMNNALYPDGFYQVLGLCCRLTLATSISAFCRLLQSHQGSTIDSLDLLYLHHPCCCGDIVHAGPVSSSR